MRLLSATDAMIFQRLKAGKMPQWIGDPHAIHTFNYTRDAARAAATLAQTGGAPWGSW
jgi:hypothetical protein